MTTRWLDRAAADAWLDVVAVLQLLPAALDSQLEGDAGLSFIEFLTLAQLAEVHDGTLRVTDLAAATHSSLPRISRVIGRLERRGYLTRCVAEQDGRARHITLTRTGHAALASAATGHIALVNDLVVDRLTPDQLGALGAAAGVIADALDPERRVLAPTLSGSRGRPGLSRAPVPEDREELPEA